MFLEAQFGEDAITPISKPRLATTHKDETKSNGEAPAVEGDEGSDVEAEKARAQAEAAELERLHALGIPVPGLEIKVDKSVALVWLENMEVECSTRSLADRVRAVVERATEVVAPLWE